MDLRQRLARHLVYPLSLWRSGDLATLRYLREFERTQYLSPEELRDRQLELLRGLLDHAYQNCPFYRERFIRAGLVPSDVRRLEDLQALPPLEKTDVQAHRLAMIARDWPADDLIENRTGGSTGTPVAIYFGRNRLCARVGGVWRHNRWAGWDIGHKTAALWGAPRDVPPTGWRGRLRNALLDRLLYLDTGHMNEEKLLRYHEMLHAYRPRVILAYACAAALFARFLEARKLRPYRPHSIVTSAEVLSPEDRAVVERVFGCPVFDRYGSRELCVIASECEAHAGLHVMAEGLYVEVVRNGRPAAPGETGVVLITDLRNRAMPLIRYRIGDVASWEEEPCRCGRGLPRLRAVTGRVTDFLVGSDGRLVSGAFLAYALIAQRVSLGQVQIDQTEPGKVCYRIKPGATFRQLEDLAYLERQTRRYLGEGTAVEYELVEELLPEPSGKFLLSRSTVTPAYLTA
ncbi:MAG: phenylacetate--CoA ligase family protein [Gemmataceae bacterium]|nr:phenylacetate--CoA ligase family protein [Gemmataceae bacterium]